MTKKTSPAPVDATRRRLLAGALTAGGLSLAGGVPFAALGASAQQRSSARIVVAGAGAGGLYAASLLARKLDGATIVVLDRRETHQYQPGYTLVAIGLWGLDRVQWPNAEYMPPTVQWIRKMVAEFDPDANQIVAEDGERIPYDFLIVATGLALRYDLIDGMSPALLGAETGIGSVYASAEGAARTWDAMARFQETGGVGLFTRPPGDIKCAGAPLKIAFLTDHRLREARARGRAELIYNAHNDALFAVPVVDARVKELFGQRGMKVNYSHVLEAVEPGARRARFRHGDETVEMDYDFLHVAPPMSAPQAVADSPLAWQEGPFAAQGWIEVDMHSLRHRRYPNVFGVGDVNGVPKGKTAASVKWQAPVTVDNMLAAIAGREPTASYNGYTSCPLITKIGQAMLIEFDYDGNLVSTLPLIDPLKESWAAWVVEDQGLRPVYAAMLRGYA